MLNINPELNIDLELLKAKVKALNIRSEEDLKAASELLGEIKEAYQAVEGKEDSDLAIIEQRRLDVIAENRPLKNDIKSLEDTVKAEMLSYKERAKMMIEQIRSDISSGKVERYETYIGEDGKIVNESALTIRTDKGLSSNRKYIVFKVNDFSLLPDAYKNYDRKKILQDLKKGIIIPGVSHETKEAMQYRVKKAV